MLLIELIVMAITIAVLFSLIENNSIVINTRDGIVRECTLPFLVPTLALLSFSQRQMKFVGIKEIVSKRFKAYKEGVKLVFRNNLEKVSYKLYFLGNGKQRDGPFLGNEVGTIAAGAS
jgi:hypothetical protein